MDDRKVSRSSQTPRSVRHIHSSIDLKQMASQLLFVNIEFLHPSSTRIINGLSFYSPSTISNLRDSLSENLSIPSRHLHFLQNGCGVTDKYRLTDKDTYQVYLQQPVITSVPSIFIAFFYHRSIHLLDLSLKKVYTSLDQMKIGESIIYVDWSTFDDDEDQQARISLKKDLIDEFGLETSSSLFGINMCPFQHIKSYQEFLDKLLEEDEEEEEQFEFDPEDNIDGDEDWN
jgi:hypothetical protein